MQIVLLLKYQRYVYT